MKAWTWGTIIAFSLIFPSGVLADTIITFVEREGAVDVFIDPDPQAPKPNRTVAGESADTVRLTDPGFLKGPLGRRACFTCPTGLFGAVLFEPGTSEVSDFIVAQVVFGIPPEVDSEFFFASDPDISKLADMFQLAGRPNAGHDLLNVLTTKVPRTDETGKEQTIQFFDLNGAPVALPSGPPFPFFFTGGDIIIKATSDLEVVPEPTTLLLGTTAAGLGLIHWWRGRRKEEGRVRARACRAAASSSAGQEAEPH
jgi:hypothetical protein